ncbi:pirin family protein [Helicobacter sp. NHP21005]|uniref:pirin family protein n=1 Tax=Helicobacter felistomachi TaxID=3040201 RepID=UPI0025723A93|nr:pirin family protein [Helicobacter sp. NHP21005]BEG56845.1 pirin family protein [Helicobacter sp. NHP21005]
MKKVARIYKAPPKHWMGNGFYVATMFSYKETYKNVDPFLLLDYNAPYTFKPSAECLGVGPHPHRGFETITLVYQGEMKHSDSHGVERLVPSGGVQWMTAGFGVLHQELLSKKFCQQGGVFEMVQIWLNLPKAHKMTPPKYQAINPEQIPVAPFKKSQVRVVAGALNGVEGAAQTFSPVNVWDIELRGFLSLPIPQEHNILILVREGLVSVDQQEASAQHLITFQKGGQGVHLEALKPSQVLVLTGLPLDEPIVGHGPFVMHNKAEIEQALEDFNAGKFGTLKAGHGD